MKLPSLPTLQHDKAVKARQLKLQSLMFGMCVANVAYAVYERVMGVPFNVGDLVGVGIVVAMAWGLKRDLKHYRAIQHNIGLHEEKR